MKNSKVSSIILGLAFISCGLLWLLSNLFPSFGLNWGILWPVFLLVPGVIMWGSFITSSKKNRDFGILIPANILLFLSFTFFFNMVISEYLQYGEVWVWTVFMYPASVAIAFWITWFASGRKNPLVIPAVILSIISLIVFVFTTGSLFFIEIGGFRLASLFWPLLIICIGLLVLSGPFFTLIWGNDKKFMGKNENEWKNWGEKFGKDMETWGEEFGKDMERTFDPDYVEEAQVVKEERKNTSHDSERASTLQDAEEKKN